MTTAFTGLEFTDIQLDDHVLPCECKMSGITPSVKT